MSDEREGMQATLAVQAQTLAQNEIIIGLLVQELRRLGPGRARDSLVDLLATPLRGAQEDAESGGSRALYQRASATLDDLLRIARERVAILEGGQEDAAAR